MVEIRKATLDDEARVFDLLRQLITSASADHPVNQKRGSDTFRKMLDDDDAGTVFVAEEDGVMLGLVTLSYPLAIRCGGPYSSIEEFIVTEQARGKGVGGALLEAAVTKATEKGCYELLVSRPSDLGLPVYIRHGWKDDGKALLMHLPRETS